MNRTFHQYLHYFRMTKAALARELGMKPGTVYRWDDDTVPAHVMALLRLKFDNAVLLAVISQPPFETVPVLQTAPRKRMFLNIAYNRLDKSALVGFA